MPNTVHWYSDPFLPCFAFLLILWSVSLETMCPRVLGKLQAAAERDSLEPGRQEGGGSHFPPNFGNNRGFQGIEGSNNQYHWEFGYQGCEPLGLCWLQKTVFQWQQDLPGGLQPHQHRCMLLCTGKNCALTLLLKPLLCRCDQLPVLNPPLLEIPRVFPVFLTRHWSTTESLLSIF